MGELGRRCLCTLVLVALMAAGCSRTPATTPSSGRAATGAAAEAPPPRVSPVQIARVRQPLGMAIREGDDALYIVSKRGTVWALRAGSVDPDPVLDLTGQVALGDEQGLLGMAFSPSGEFAYVDYTDRRGDTNVVEYAWRDGRADLSARRLVLFVRQPFPNHNGGNLVFGPDGYLYVGLGDGGSDFAFGDPQGDPYRNGQNLRSMLGKMLRIEPRMPDGSLPPGGGRYAVPADNPFVDREGSRPEIWAYGLRHPWRYSFDRESGDLWIGDVGAGAREEIDVQPAGSDGGENYGWNALEGTVAYRAAPVGSVAPVYEYDHRAGGCAITGGFVYRGRALPRLRGWFVFGDYCLGTLNALRLLPDGGRRIYVISGTGVPQLASFGEDRAGELYALSLAGEVLKLVPA